MNRTLPLFNISSSSGTIQKEEPPRGTTAARTEFPGAVHGSRSPWSQSPSGRGPSLPAAVPQPSSQTGDALRRCFPAGTAIEYRKKISRAELSSALPRGRRASRLLYCIQSLCLWEFTAGVRELGRCTVIGTTSCTDPGDR